MTLNLRTKISLYATSVVILSITCLVFISVLTTQKLILTNTLEKEMPNRLLSIKEKINQELNTPLTIAKLMANNQYVLDFLNNEEPKAELSEVTEYLARIKTSFNAATSFLVSVKTNNYYMEKGISQQLSSSKPVHKWFYTFLNSSKDYEFNLDYDHNKPNSLMVFINYKIKDKNNQTIGVTGIGLSIGKMLSTIKNSAIAKHGKIYLVDGKNQIAVAKEQPLVGLKMNQIFPQAKALLNQTGFARSDFNDDRMLATHYISNLDWHVAMVFSKAEIMAGLGSLEGLSDIPNSLTIAGIILSIVFLLLSVVLMRRWIKT